MATRIFLLALSLFAASAGAENLKRVAFYQDTVSELDGKVLKFMMGSTWVLEREIVALPLSEGVIICDGPAPQYIKERLNEYLKALPTECVLAYEGNTVNATRVDGPMFLQDGFLARVIESLGDGAILRTDDGSLWSIPSYDRYDTGYWLPPYPVLIFSNELYMINLKEGKKVWVKKRVN